MTRNMHAPAGRHRGPLALILGLVLLGVSPATAGAEPTGPPGSPPTGTRSEAGAGTQGKASGGADDGLPGSRTASTTPAAPTATGPGTPAPNTAPAETTDPADPASTAARSVPTPSAPTPSAPEPSRRTASPLGKALSVTGAGTINLVVHGGSHWTGSGTTDLAPMVDGVTFQARRTGQTGTAGECTTAGGTGSCTIEVPAPTGWTKYRYVVKITGTPAGWYLNPTIGLGTAWVVSEKDYLFTTRDLTAGDAGRSVHIPAEGADTASVKDGADRNFSARKAVSRDDPAADGKCGSDIALVLDVSGSMKDNSKLTTLKTSVGSILTTLSGTNARIAGYSFAAGTGSSRALTSMKDPQAVTQFRTWVNGLSADGATNWDQGLWQVAAARQRYDMVVLVTDGNPSTDRFGGVGGDETRTRFVERAVLSANAVKGKGTRIVALGVDMASPGAVANLRAVSGPTAGTDYLSAASSDFGTTLRNLVTANCQGKILLTKQVEPWDGDAEDRTPAAGWQFDVSVDGDQPQTLTTPNDESKVLEIPLTFPTGSESRQVAVTEKQKSGHEVVRVGGKNAVCTVDGGTANVATDTSAADNTGFQVSVKSNQTVVCTMVNKASPPAASATVAKKWVVDGAAAVPHGDQPQGLSAQLTVGGANKGWGTAIGGQTAGGTITIGETATVDTRTMPGCSITQRLLTGTGITGSLDVSAPQQVTLAAGTNAFTITNTVTCTSTLTLHKVVDNTGGGTATLADFGLKAVPAAGGNAVIDGPDPVAGQTRGIGATVAPGAYDLSETGPGGYSASQWACTGGSVTQKGAGKATVTVGRGAATVCTLTNTAVQPTLTLKKRVEAAGTGDTTPATAWTLSAAGSSTTISGKHGDQAVTSRAVPAGTYTLSESDGPATHTPAGWTCTGSQALVTQVTLSAGQDVTCTAVNRANAPDVTVSKQVFKGTEPWDGAQVRPGDELTWRITVTNRTGSVPYTGPAFTDDLSDLLTAVDLGTGPVFTTSDAALTVDWSNSVLTGRVTGLAGGASVSVAFTGTVKALKASSQIEAVTNLVTPAQGVMCTTGDPDCETTNPLAPEVQVTKTVEKKTGTGPTDWTTWDGKAVAPGDRLRWRVTAANTSTVAYDGTLYTDDLATTVAGTDLELRAESFVADPATVSYSFAGSVLTAALATGQSLAAGSSLTVTYEAVVTDWETLIEAKTTSIDNVVIPAGHTACPTEADCVTTNPLTPEVQVSKTVTKGGADWNGKEVSPGDQLTWTLTAHNISSVPYEGDLFADDLTAVLAASTAPATAPTLSVSPPGTLRTAWQGTGGRTLSASTLTGGLPAGTQATVAFTITVADAAALAAGGITTIGNVLLPTGTTTCVPAQDEDENCTTDNPLTPSVDLTKTVERHDGTGWVDWDGKPVASADRLRWTLAASNTSTVPYTGKLFTDDLARIVAGTDIGEIDVADFTSDPAGALDIGVSGTTVSGATAPDTPLGAGETATVTFEATVADPATLVKNEVQAIGNVLVPDGEIPGCVPTAGQAPDCTTDNPLTPEVRVSKTVTKGEQDWDGKPVEPGDELTWTIGVANVSAVPFTGELLRDDLSEILAATDLTARAGSFTVSDPSVSVEVQGTTLVVTAPTGRDDAGGLAAGARVTIRYTATVKALEDLPAGTERFGNVVVPTGDVQCVPKQDEDDKCETVNRFEPKWTVAKTSRPASGKAVLPGEAVTYMLRLTSLSPAPAADVVVTDALSDVMPFVQGPPVLGPGAATIGQAQVHGTGPDSTLRWDVGTLPGGSTHTLTYTVTVAEGTWGKRIANLVTATGATPPEDCAAPLADPAKPGAKPGAKAGAKPGATSGAKADAKPGAKAAQDVCSTEHRVPVLPTVELVKTVKDEWNAGAEATDWILAADGGAGAGDPTRPGKPVGGPGGVSRTGVLPGTYALAESPAADFPGDPTAYDAGTWSCTTGPDTPVEVGEKDTVTLDWGDAVTCTITNTARPAHLTLTKTVRGLGKGGKPAYTPAGPKDWILGADPVSGPAVSGPGDPGAEGAVVDRSVAAGLYTLSEKPAAGREKLGERYTHEGWFCSPDGETGANRARLSGDTWTVDLRAGTRTKCVATNAERPPASLELVKKVSSLHDTAGTEKDWTLSAEPGDGVPAPPEDGVLTGAGGFGPTLVWPGTYTLGETASPTTDSFDPRAWKAGTWHCRVTEPGDDRPGPWLPAGEAAVELTWGQKAVCTVTNTDYEVDLGLTKTAIDFGPTVRRDEKDRPVVDAGDTFTYRLTVADRDRLAGGMREGHDAHGVRVSDPIPSHLKVLTDALAKGLTGDWQAEVTGADAEGFGGTLTLTSAEGLKAGTDIGILVPVEVGPGATGDTVNTACVTSPVPDAREADNCDSAETLTSRIVARMQTECRSDAAWLDYDIATRNVPDAEKLPITLTWYTDTDRDGRPDGPAVRTDTIAAGQARSGSVLWPGTTRATYTDPDSGRKLDVTTGWPGWRAAKAGESAQYEDQVADATLDTHAYTGDMIVVTSINPEARSVLTYPMDMPYCAEPRTTQPRIEKVGPTQVVPAGDPFDFTLTVTNPGPGAIRGVVVNDPIPTALKVVDVRPAEPTGAAPAWKTCQVTGRDEAGYGGTLHCTLSGALDRGVQAPPVVLTVRTSPEAEDGTVLNIAQVCWEGSEMCREDEAEVTVGGEGTQDERTVRPTPTGSGEPGPSEANTPTLVGPSDGREPTAATAGDRRLPLTGAAIGPFVVLASLGLILGGTLWFVARRRRTRRG